MKLFQTIAPAWACALRMRFSHLLAERRLRLLAVVMVLAGALPSCAVNVRQVPDPPVARNPAPYCARTLYLGRFEVRGGHERDYAQNMKRSLAYFIAARRGFVVKGELRDTAAELPTNYYVLDVDASLGYDDSYNWWLTWPAAYPLSGYWPLQVRTGKIEVVLSGQVVDQSGRSLLKFERKRAAERTVYFYGFFRTGGFEDEMRSVTEQAFRDVGTVLAESARDLCAANDASGSTRSETTTAGQAP